MPVDDDLAEIGGAAQKFVPDPQQVVDALPVQRNARSHARVAHKISVDHGGRFQRLEKREVLVRYCGAQRLCRIRVVLADHQLADWHAIGMDGLEPAEVPPMLDNGRVVEEGLEQRLVVSLQRDGARRKGVAHEAIEHAARIRSAIDVVAKRNGQAIAGRVGLEIARYQCDHAIEQVGSAMNIADDVDASLTRRGGLRTHEAHVAGALCRKARSWVGAAPFKPSSWMPRYP